MSTNIESKLDNIHAMLQALCAQQGLSVEDRTAEMAKADKKAADAWKPGSGELWLASYGDPNNPRPEMTPEEEAQAEAQAQVQAEAEAQAQEGPQEGETDESNQSADTEGSDGDEDDADESDLYSEVDAKESAGGKKSKR